MKKYIGLHLSFNCTLRQRVLCVSFDFSLEIDVEFLAKLKLDFMSQSH